MNALFLIFLSLILIVVFVLIFAYFRSSMKKKTDHIVVLAPPTNNKESWHNEDMDSDEFYNNYLNNSIPYQVPK